MLVVGGTKDFNITHLLSKIKEEDIDCEMALLAPEEEANEIIWNIEENQLILGGRAISPNCIFSRADVFNSLERKDAAYVSHSWHQSLRTYAIVNDSVRAFNKRYINLGKTYNLIKARALGFRIPETIITNEFSLLNKMDEPEQYIVKRILGGKETVSLSNFLLDKTISQNDQLVYVQERISAPEYRIFGIGNQAFTFQINSRSIDYRQDLNVAIELIPNKAPYVEKLLKLMQVLQLDFCAADLRTHAATGEWVFLEINSGPMFAKFDQIAGGKLCSAMISWLMNE